MENRFYSYRVNNSITKYKIILDNLKIRSEYMKGSLEIIEEMEKVYRLIIKTIINTIMESGKITNSMEKDI